MDRVVAATVGVTSAGLGVAVGQLVAALTEPAASPILAVGASVVDLTPQVAREFAIRTFGSHDKLALTLGILVVTAVLAAMAGLVGARSRAAGVAVVTVLGVVLVLAAVSRPAAGVVSVLPGLLTTLVGGAALLAQLRWVDRGLSPRAVRAGGRLPPIRVAPGSDAGVAGPGPRRGWMDRRAFFAGSAGIAAGAGLLAWAADALVPGQGLSPGVAAPQPVVLPPVASPPPPLPAGLETSVRGVTPLVTPIGDFYRVDTALSVPTPNPSSWKLTIGGRVAQPYTLTLAELLAMPLVERDITLTCVSNPVGGPYCGSTRWTGVLVADLLRRAAPDPGADMVLSRSVDGFTASTPLAVLLDGRDAMIAVAMDGKPLTATHGAPARLLTPGLYGYVGATKWLSELKVTTFAADSAYWTHRGWADHAPVKTAARIDTPTGTLPAGQVPIAGVAWATHRGIARVEVQVDQGPWQEATLGPDVGLDYWRQWYLPWEATPGRHRLRARAYDMAGQVQTDEVEDVIPDGATGYPVINVEVRT
ncbi:molybdopterin-dependent oxidoreductase [Raineyella fluvialis]|uniref:Molybdopterin-dependent oxidoreductase n=1 Tax=Raineyella fluvialis TaxID=2662261 RepID=A0A5Q2F714_9ACTN|nr:molybdopterin-dependent oxidoreductase [Raineyella fluvialis]QGF22458.1 molybdopterin-dependent oxidoreductase [Raineyella fluvialis]